MIDKYLNKLPTNLQFLLVLLLIPGTNIGTNLIQYLQVTQPLETENVLYSEGFPELASQLGWYQKQIEELEEANAALVDRILVMGDCE